MTPDPQDPSRARAAEVAATWARLERESPSTYWEENAILGRRDTFAAFRARMRPLEGRRILDAGCGRGLLARWLTHAGALVTGVDLSVDHVLEARERAGGGPSFVAADFRHLAASRGTFDDIVLQEVLEDYDSEGRVEIYRWLAGSGAKRIHLIFRQPGQWAGLIGPLLPAALTTTLDPVQLLRSVHLHTPYRVSHQESVRRRSYNARWVELSLQPELASSTFTV